MTSFSSPHVQWPAHLPHVDLEVTLVLIRDNTTQALEIWLVHALPAQDPPHPNWVPVKAWTKRVGNRHQLMFWRRVVTPEEWLHLLDVVAQSDEFPTNNQQIPVSAVPRAPVLLAAAAADTALSPVLNEAVWLWEWWNPDKAVMAPFAKDRVHQINAQVRTTLGIDLNLWKDRVGNILVFFPSGLRMRLHYDVASRQLIVYTTLAQEVTPAYEVDVRGWDGEDLMLARRIPLERPSVVLQDVPPCTRFAMSLWRGSELVHPEEERGLIRAIVVDMDLHVGSHGGRSYTRRGASTHVGSEEIDPWTRLQRERQVDNQRAELAREPKLKFYAPDGTSVQRLEAVADLTRILTSARDTLRIWDPYFGTNAANSARGTPEDDLHFIEQISRLDVSIRILTSTDDWTAASGSARLSALTTRLQAEHAASPSRFGRVVWRAWVRANDTAFHDRFIVVDDDKVWLLGSSINGMGKKHTTLVHVEYPQEILVAFDRIWRGQTHGVGRVLSVFGPLGSPHAP